MNISTYKIISNLAFCGALGVAAYASPSPVGAWNGHVKVTLGAGATAQQKQQLQTAEAMIAKTKFSLKIKKDHTFTAVLSGLQGTQNDNGTWSLVREPAHVNLQGAPWLQRSDS